SFFGIRPDSTRIDATGGWHDAGDQLKYLITSSNTTARLLMAYQMDPDGYMDQVNARGLPGQNQIPDILDEAKWGLEWILKLHPSPNELYHQVADDRDHRGFKLPHEENADYGWGPNSFRPAYFATGEPQGLSQYQSQATGIANLAGRSAATLALGYEVFSQIEGYEVFAQSCLKSAHTLYEMGKKQEGYQQGNSFGAPYRYEENTWADDMEWAAAKLYKVTKKPEFLEDARRYGDLIAAWSWMERDTASHYEMYPYVNMGHYALWQVGNEEDKQKMVNYYEQNLEKIQARANQNPYGVGHLFIWCSNNLAAAVATQAMLYEEMTGSRKYRPLLQNHVNWLLGLNPWSSSMITEIPENADTPVDVHMPFWKILNKSVKGSLVDGPLWSTIHQQMLGITPSKPDEYAHLQPLHIKYLDDWADYSTNEPTLDGSAELLLILKYLSLE
ncbi:MAG: glycoside hydrolase family 9 protein, partial [Cyclobacteriaceae bacterium]|nr:glycoside hydrolase family 9 protein [Cyclobacteriaceae bacterium]